MNVEIVVLLILMLGGMSLAFPLPIRTDVIVPSDDMDIRMVPLFDPADFHKEHITLFDDYGIQPIPPRFPPYLVHGQGTYKPDLDEEYY